MISKTEAIEALLRSGYLLEQRVKTLLGAEWSYVEQNVNYLDETTGKYREYDLRAVHSLPLWGSVADWVMASLAIECVNNPEPFVVLTHEETLPELNPLNLRVAGAPVFIPGDDGSELSFADHLTFSDHHYVERFVGTQFCSFATKKAKPSEWMASHDDMHFESIAKVCAAVDYHARDAANAWLHRREPNVNLTILYPVLVLQGDLWEGRPSKRSVTLRARGHLQLQRPLVSRNSRRTYQIDVVTEKQLPRLLKQIESEIALAAVWLRANRDSVRKSVADLLKAAPPSDETDLMSRLTI